MSVLDDLKDLLTPGADEDLPPSEEIASRREEVRSEIERLEAELRELRSDEGRREALAEADSPEEVGRRRRLLRDRIDGLEELDDELVRRQRATKEREMQRDLLSTVERLPDLADEFEEARAAERRARSRLEETLAELGEAHMRLDQRDLTPDVALPDAQVDRLKRLSDSLPGHHDRTLDGLRPAEGEEEPERRIVEDVQHQIRYLTGDWSDVDDWRERVPPAPAGWTTDVSRARGLVE